MELDKAIECTRDAHDQQWQPSQLSVTTANKRQVWTCDSRLRRPCLASFSFLVTKSKY